MFYSLTYLSKKGPLGTVWCAAHLQHRLKKSHYTSTNIPEAVDLIIFPSAPMALRMSGHLLLGVVRIYSKQVDYLFRDCNLFNNWLSKAFVSTQVDLPEGSRQAPVEVVTLPQTLNLDDFNLEDDNVDREFDNNLRSAEDITLTDQIPTGIDPYVSITFDEDIFPEATPMDVDQSTEPMSEQPRDADVEMAGPSNEQRDTEEIPEFADPNLTELINQSPERSRAVSPGSVPEIEIRRDAAQELSPFAAEQENATAERAEPTLSEKEPTIPIVDEETLISRGDSTFQLRSGSPGSAPSDEGRADFGVLPSPQLVLQPSPPPQPQARPRKRKHFDKVTVLTNRIMRERLEDPSDIIRKRTKLPSSKLNIWRLNNQSKKDQSFNEPLLTGLSDALRSVFDKDFVSSKPYLSVPIETVPEPEAEPEVNPSTPLRQQSPVPESVQLSPRRQSEDVQDSAGLQSPHAETATGEAQSPPLPDIERLREGGFSEFMPSPSLRSSPFRTDDFTTHPESWESGATFRTEPEFSESGATFRTGDSTTHAESWKSGPSTSTSTYTEDLLGRSGLSDIPEMVDEELYFLEVGSNTPERSPSSQDSDALTGRTRALAEYLKERSSTSRVSSGDLSLSTILEGKKRKIAARMFFETLVLKSRGLIDVEQDQPYSDITLKLMPSLFRKVQP